MLPSHVPGVCVLALPCRSEGADGKEEALERGWRVFSLTVFIWAWAWHSVQTLMRRVMVSETTPPSHHSAGSLPSPVLVFSAPTTASAWLLLQSSLSWGEIIRKQAITGQERSARVGGT